MDKYIDISTHQKGVNYAKVKADGIVGVLLRAGHTGYGSQSMHKDELFEQHYAGFKSVGLPMGAYWFSRANTVEMAIKEAKLTLQFIYGKELKLPIYFDTEDNVYQDKCSRQLLTDIAKAFCKTIADAGYVAGVYASTSWLNNRLDMKQIEDLYEVWVAQYASVCTYKRKYQIWQYTSKAYVDGIGSNVDMNNVYKKYHMESEVEVLPMITGIWDEDHTKALQIEFKTTFDGLISGQYKHASIANIKGVRYGIPTGSQLVRAIQRKLDIFASGFLNKETIKALQKYFGTTQDGYISANSKLVKAMKTKYRQTGRFF